MLIVKFFKRIIVLTQSFAIYTCIEWSVRNCERRLIYCKWIIARVVNKEDDKKNNKDVLMLRKHAVDSLLLSKISNGLCKNCVGCGTSSSEKNIEFEYLICLGMNIYPTRQIVNKFSIFLLLDRDTLDFSTSITISISQHKTIIFRKIETKKKYV